ncbi:MAG: hypothetical protein HXY51_08205 [Nitrospirae bacterium]|nr:hypothetical protein [Nitrospirota bacterium]
MQKIAAVALFFLLVTPLAWAGETEPFDPEQPFQQGFSTSVLRSLLNKALDVLEDHLEITGNVAPDDVKGDRRGNLRFKFYPEGKSKSYQHHQADGSFRFSPDLALRDFYFRFKSLEEPAKNSSQQFSDVL